MRGFRGHLKRTGVVPLGGHVAHEISTVSRPLVGPDVRGVGILEGKGHLTLVRRDPLFWGRKSLR